MLLLKTFIISANCDLLFIKVIKKAYQNSQTFVSIATVQWHINSTDFVLVFILIFIPFLSVWGIVKNVHLSPKCLYQKILYDFSSSTLNTFDPFTSSVSKIRKDYFNYNESMFHTKREGAQDLKLNIY